MKTTNNSNEKTTDAFQRFFKNADPIRWEGEIYCMGCGVFVAENEPLNELEFSPFDYMCLACHDKVKELRIKGKEAERVDELIKSIAKWD